jgi:pimeloyl-ACP methyl ester carboxylesterase
LRALFQIGNGLKAAIAQHAVYQREDRVEKPLLRKSHRKWLFLTLLIIALYYAYTQLTAPRGNQKVSFVPASKTCHASGTLKYCIYRAKSGTNGDVVYHLHGRNLDEQIWNDDTYWTSMVQANWQQTKVLPPTVVVISYGPIWLLAPKGKKPDSGLLEKFMAKLPDIDEKTGTPKRRLLLGESMGGLNVLIAGLTYPESFAKIASLCPGVYAISPFASLSSMKEALERTGADPKIGFGIWLMAKKYVADEKEWKRISPLDLAKRANGQYPAMYLSNGLYDAYGNFEGTQILAEKAARRGVSVEWHPLYGGHCATDTSSLALFLAS